MADRCGGYYLGRPGHMVRIDDNHVRLTRDYEDNVQLQTSLGGGRRAYVSAFREPRSWSVEVGPSRVAAVDPVHAVVTALMPPYGWVTPWGQVTNLLTPEWSTLQAAGLTPAGMVRSVDGGWHAMSYTATGPVHLGAAFVVPGRPVCAAVYADGGTILSEWLNASGAVIGSSDTQGADPTWILTTDTVLAVGTVLGQTVNMGTGEDVPGGLPRRWATAMPPAGAAFVRISITGATKLAAPALTWTDKPQPWGIGDGVASVVVRRGGDTPHSAVPDDPNMIRHSVSWTVHEVGPGAGR